MAISELAKIRRDVFTEIARLALSGRLKEMPDATKKIIPDGPARYRCCIYKERAIVEERLVLANGGRNGKGEEISAGPVVQILETACNGCSLDKFTVTDACVGCVAHHCKSNCPKDAIMIVQGRAYIDQSRCVECGSCRRACKYGAIIELARPCERACPVQALHVGEGRLATIDYDKCIFCGKCVEGCPFGAAADVSFVGPVCEELYKKEKKLYAILAPSIVGQFGVKVTIDQIKAALKLLGFAGVMEAACGADATVISEGEEFLETVPKSRPFMTTSCCPAFVEAIAKHLPEHQNKVSHTPSPMAFAAKMFKKEDPDGVVVFIGPCIAKKHEATKIEEMDYVLTFEELFAIFHAAQIKPEEIVAEVASLDEASRDGRGFAKAGGVAKAVENYLLERDSGLDIHVIACQGIAECLQTLKDIAAGKIFANLVEGMSCTGGCVGGPGVLNRPQIVGKQVEKLMQDSSLHSPLENTRALEILHDAK